MEALHEKFEDAPVDVIAFLSDVDEKFAMSQRRVSSRRPRAVKIIGVDNRKLTVCLLA
ncbi:hypothetical protein [Sinorhizobium fredii]|uniref:Uncharacterized protein n=1 Tax=Sinorhizobium fredii (strain HH103) TaxID=1117943 RepID=G9AI14_SINF1|nr:hypothetical protein [Sinorhizobium fredii]AWI61187.1 hypothetical protein AB395_00006010 [Sinorhizobium fredii CCBAU 45436]CCF00696.1 hypothetical protein predicted by Glimmer/Critica [Sinorhizobium fredii HH103]